MADTVRATCPGCQNVLRIPADWTDRAVKCKNCGTVVQTKNLSKAKPTAATPTPTIAARPVNKPSPKIAAGSAPVESLPQVYGYPPGFAPPQPESTVDPLTQFDVGPMIQRRPKIRSGPGPLLWVGSAFFLAMTGLFGVLVGPTLVKKFRATEQAQTPTSQPILESRSVRNTSKQYPRRMLFLSVTKYLYCNALVGGTDRNPDQVTVAARRLAAQWKVPVEKENSQLYVVQDLGPTARPMLKPTIEDACKQFCETSRAQDRVLIYFGGHAVEIGDKAYLVPVDGDLEDVASLIPLDDFWAKIKSCPAQQKLVVFDVCRLNEDGDKLRPGSEPLSESLEKRLTKAPSGVQVVMTTTVGQNAFEYRQPPYISRRVDTSDVGGSLFLSALRHVGEKGVVQLPKDPTPDDSLPIAPWLTAANTRMKEVTTGSGKAEPVARLIGDEPTATVAFNPEEPLAKHFALAPQPKGVAPDDLAKILERINVLPPYRGKISKDDAVETLIPFTEDVMKVYQPDKVTDAQILKEPQKYPIRKAAIDGLTIIKKEWKSSVEGELRTRIETGSDDKVKKLIVAEQETPARIEEELRTTLTKMEKLMPELDQEESKYWRVNFLYAVAQLKARLAFMSEYNLALGSIRTDSLPKVDAKQGSSGFILVSSDKMKSKKDVKDLADSARDLFTKIAEDHKGTPWAIQAKRHRVIALGLEWKPFTSGLASAME